MIYFIPSKESNTFTFDRYIKEIEDSIDGRDHLEISGALVYWELTAVNGY